MNPPPDKGRGVWDLSGRTILVTGGTGSFGQKFTELVLRECDPTAVRIFSRDELKQSEMRRKMDDPRLRFLIGDVRDRERLYRAMDGVDILVHAAALKQVPTAEYNPIEAVKTNINGTMNVSDAAIDNDVGKVLLISTDKAAHPVNLYGATKLVAEKLMIQANSYVGRHSTRFSCVRYGNVLGSRGSVIPLFMESRESSVIDITDRRMTRFFITLEQGVRFVIDSLGRMVGGEVFVPKMPAASLMDIAAAVAPGARIEIIGIRPGEKLHEELITPEEAPRTREFDTYYVIEPDRPFWDDAPLLPGTAVPWDFHYRSETNPWRLTGEELQACVTELANDARH